MSARAELVKQYANAIVVARTSGLITMTASNRPAIMLAYAIMYAVNGWEIFPLGAKKAPRIKSPHPRGHRCKGECGQDGHGAHDATTDIDTIYRWWALDYPGANIGGRVPGGVFVLDLDPRKLGHAAAMGRLIADHGPLPHTLTTLSGRADGGRHLFYRRPRGKLSIAGLGPEFAIACEPGIDIKDRGGLIVLPPSVHHVSGKSYVGIEAPIASLPGSLIDAIVRPPAALINTIVPADERAAGNASRAFLAGGLGQSPTEFNDSTTWRDLLGPHGWTCLDDDSDADGARWVHPTATADHSATITDGRLYVYSTSTMFEPTASGGDRHGYSKFDAHQLLNPPARRTA